MKGEVREKLRGDADLFSLISIIIAEALAQAGATVGKQTQLLISSS